MKHLLFVLVLLSFLAAAGQKNYEDSLETYIKDYVAKHEVVKNKDRKHLHFYSVNKDFRIAARFEKTDNSPWFKMETSGLARPMYRVYGKLHFMLHDTAVTLSVYQSQNLLQSDKYREHLFIPFTDATSGVETYEGGRYIDFNISDIRNDSLVIDFNKAYNPYCAYVSNVYNCPIPPAANRLTVAIKAGEKAFGKNH